YGFALTFNNKGAVTSVYACGSFDQIGGVTRHYAAQLDANGNATAWAPEPDGYVSLVVPSGSVVYLAGAFTHAGGASRAYLAAVDGSGAATGWDPEPDSRVNTIGLTGSYVFVGGDFSGFHALSRNNLAAFDAVTGMPTSWNPGTNGTVNALLVNGSR